MKERPILFSTPMVRAILEGRKSQTRRIIKPQPESIDHKNHKLIPYSGSVEFLQRNLKCPYGKPGDILWLRETWQKIEGDRIIYKADPIIWGGKWKPSIFMPKEASRIKLKVTNIRVERIQGISYEDAVLEGIESSNEFQSNEGYLHQYKDYIVDDFALDAVDSYHTLWESINGKDSWKSNPWVWVIELERIK